MLVTGNQGRSVKHPLWQMCEKSWFKITVALILRNFLGSEKLVDSPAVSAIFHNEKHLNLISAHRVLKNIIEPLGYKGTIASFAFATVCHIIQNTVLNFQRQFISYSKLDFPEECKHLWRIRNIVLNVWESHYFCNTLNMSICTQEV